MASWDILKNSIANIIKENGNQEITGQTLQSVLFSIIDNVGWKYTYYGPVNPNDPAPVNTDGNLFVIPMQKGVYPNFSGLSVDGNKACIFYLGQASGAASKSWYKHEIPVLLYDAAKMSILFLNAATKAYGYYINLNGSLISDVNYNTTEYLSIAPEEDILYMGGTHKSAAALSFYDENKVFISATNFEETTTLGFKIEISKAPSNAKYVRATYRVNEDFSIAPRNYMSSIKHIATTVANSVSDFIGEADINGDGVSVYRNVGSKAIWNTTHRFALLDFTATNKKQVSSIAIIKVSVYDYENKVCDSFDLCLYIGQEKSSAPFRIINPIHNSASTYIESIKYNGLQILITFAMPCKHRIIHISEIASPNKQGNIDEINTTFYYTLPTDTNYELWPDVHINSQLLIGSDFYETEATNIGFIGNDGLVKDTSDTNWRYTNYLPITPGETIKYYLLGHSLISSITFYDIDKNVIQTLASDNNNIVIQGTIKAPLYSAYTRISSASNEWAIKQSLIGKQYASILRYVWDEINNLKKELKQLALKKQDLQILSPYAIYTTCNDVVADKKGRNRNYSQAVYLDHLFNGLTEELNIRFKDNIDRVVFNAPIVVTNSNETSPAVVYNGGAPLREEVISHLINGNDVIDKVISVKHRSVLNSATENMHPKVLCIGDSITYGEQAYVPDDNYTQNYAYHLMCKELFMKDKIDNNNSGYDLTFLGTYKKQKTFNYKNEEHTIITHHEGIRGISMSAHLNGSVSQFKDDITGKWSLNAWLNKYRTLDDNGVRLALGSGTGTLINSGNIHEIDVCTPTHVIIMLGANGGGALYQWQEMVNTIKTEFPNMIIGIAVPDAAGTYFPSLHPNCDEKCTIWNDTGSQGSRHNQQYNLQKMLQEYYGTQDNEDSRNVYMLPFFFVAPTAESVALRSVPLPDADFSLTRDNTFYNNYGWHASTHVNGIGQTNWGYSLYSWIKYTSVKNSL